MDLFEVIKTNSDVISHIQTAVLNTLKVYAKSDIKTKPHFFKEKATIKNMRVIGMIDLSLKGQMVSALALGLPEDVFLNIYENMFQEKLASVSSETADLVGELINIIFQSVEPELRKMGLHFQASLPKIFSDPTDKEWQRISVKQSLVIPFSTEKGDIFFEVFEQKK